MIDVVAVKAVIAVSAVIHSSDGSHVSDGSDRAQLEFQIYRYCIDGSDGSGGCVAVMQ